MRETRRPQAGTRGRSAGSRPRRDDASTRRRPQRGAGQGRHPGGPRPDRLLPCPAASPSAAPGAASPAAPARPARPSLHGPYIQWTRTVHGKTVTRTLTPAQYQAYAPWFASARRLRALTAELQALSLAEMARAEGWATITPGTSAPPRTRPVRGPNPNYPKPPKTPGDQPA